MNFINILPKSVFQTLVIQADIQKWRGEVFRAPKLSEVVASAVLDLKIITPSKKLNLQATRVFH